VANSPSTKELLRKNTNAWAMDVSLGVEGCGSS
jgi:hypothetical protein